MTLTASDFWTMVSFLEKRIRNGSLDVHAIMSVIYYEKIALVKYCYYIGFEFK